MYNFCGLYLNQPFIRSLITKLDSLQIFSHLSHPKFKTSFHTHSCPLKYTSKPRKLISFQSTKERANIEKEMNSEMSFMSYISTGGVITSKKDGVYPGTSVCFQFWITNDLLNLVAACPIPEATRLNRIPRPIATLRRYVSVNETMKNNYSEFNSGEGVTLKVMSYNVLSQALLEQHHHLYEKQSPKILSWNYRSKIILAEILAVNPDVLCLQEVEGNHVPTFYKTLENYGYQGVTKMKTGKKPDGLAIFFKVPMIKLIESETVEFNQPAVIQLASRDNVGLIAKLEKKGKKFLVANTHLLYNPKRTEVRLAQLQIFLAEIDRIKGKDPERLSVLLMGDLNSVPDSPVVTLLNESKVFSNYRPLPPCLGVSPESVHLEKESKLYHSQKQSISPCEGKEEMPAMSLASTASQKKSYRLSHPFKFHSVYDLKESPRRGVTTFQRGWVLVDYMFYSDDVRLISLLSLPSAKECDLYVHYLPNEVNPSDHLPLVGEFLIH